MMIYWKTQTLVDALQVRKSYLLEQEEPGIPEVLVEYIGPTGATVLVFAESHFTLC